MLPSVILLLAVVRLAWSEQGSIAARDWLSTALLLALLVATSLLALPGIRPGRVALGAAAALVALGVWDAASAAWSPVPSLARDEALLVGAYALAFLLPVLTLRPARHGALLVGAVVATVAGTGLAAALHLALSGGPADVHDGRLDFPIGYQNADAAFLAVALWPALALAAGRTRGIAVRAAALAAAALALGTIVAAQSKGAAVGLLVSAVVVAAVSRARLRLAVPALLSAAIVAAAFRPLTRPYRVHDALLTDAVRGMGRALVLVALAAAVGGAVYAYADRRVSLSPRARTLAGRAALAVTVAVLLAALAGFLALHPHPGRFAAAKWNSFKAGYAQKDTATTHFASLGSNRYDFWRVALKEFDRHPLAGIGARGFQDAYLQLRKSPETPARAHSVELDALSETGLVGLALLAAALGLALAAVAPRARDRLLAAGVLGAATGWLAHASVDWIWTFPAVSIPVFVLLGAAAGDDRAPRLSPRASYAGALAAVAAAVLLIAPPWLAARLVEHGTASSARWAKTFDPLSVDPYLLESSLATTPGVRIDALRSAVAKEPRDAALHYVLGLAYEAAGRKADAAAEYRRAQALDPRDPIIAAALRRT